MCIQYVLIVVFSTVFAYRTCMFGTILKQCKLINWYNPLWNVKQKVYMVYDYPKFISIKTGEA